MLDATIDLRDVDQGFRTLLQAGGDVGPLLQEAKRPLRTDVREHQRDLRGPGGRWPAISPATQRKRGRTKSGRQRWRRTLGRLPTMRQIRVIGGDTLIARPRLPWAAVHHFGGRVGRGARIPARPFLYFGADFIADIERALRAYLARTWRNA